MKTRVWKTWAPATGIEWYWVDAWYTYWNDKTPDWHNVKNTTSLREAKRVAEGISRNGLDYDTRTIVATYGDEKEKAPE